MSIPEPPGVNPIGQAVITYGLTATQAAILYAIALEGDVGHKKLRVISGISRLRTLENALERMKKLGIIDEKMGKISAKEEQNCHFSAFLNRQALLTPSKRRGGVLIDTPPSSPNADMDAPASNPQDEPKGKLANASFPPAHSPAPIRMDARMCLAIGLDAEGEDVCDTSQVRNRKGMDQLVRVLNDRAEQFAVRSGEPTPAFWKENYHFHKWMFRKGNKNHPDRDYVNKIWNGRKRRSRQRKKTP